MALLNNIYYNAAYIGFIEGAIEGRGIYPNINAAGADISAIAGTYLTLTQAAQAFATEVDSLIPFDALVSTGASNTQLAVTTNTIAANEQWRAGLLRSICRAALAGRYGLDAVAVDYAGLAAACKAAWTEGLLLLVTP